MELEYRKLAQNEYQNSLSDLSRKNDAIKSLEKSYVRFDQLIAKSISESPVKPACKSGCSFCCFYKVDIRSHEIFAIKEYMDKNFENNKIEEILLFASQNSEKIRSLSYEEHMKTNIKCPFLNESECIIYPVRPFKCRNFHATDVDRCEKSYIEPTNLSIPNSFIESVSMSGNAHSQGFEAAIEKAGYDNRVYDLNTALIEAYSESSSMKRFRKGKKSFIKAVLVLE